MQQRIDRLNMIHLFMFIYIFNASLSFPATAAVTAILILLYRCITSRNSRNHIQKHFKPRITAHIRQGKYLRLLLMNPFFFLRETEFSAFQDPEPADTQQSEQSHILNFILSSRKKFLTTIKKNFQLQYISSGESYLGFSLSCEACPQRVQRLADHCSRAGGQTATQKVNSCCLAVIRRRLVDHLSQKLKTGKLQGAC